MNTEPTYCGGRYRVRTVDVEMRMSHWLRAPVVERASDGAPLLDLSGELMDLCAVSEAGGVLVLLLRKYPGRTNDVVVRLLPEPERFELTGRVHTAAELIAALRALP